MLRKTLIVGGFLGMLAAETVYYARSFSGEVLRLYGERAFFRNDHVAAWKFYNDAIAWGGDQDRLGTDLTELILFGLDQAEIGVKIVLPLPPTSSLPLAKQLVARRLRDAPQRAYVWSLAADVYGQEATRRRREMVLDLSSLHESPNRELLAEEHLAVDALEIATQIEPQSYTYRVMLTEMLLDAGMILRAAEQSRKAMGSYPDPESHFYLQRDDLPAAVIEAALAGMEDALQAGTLLPSVQILHVAGRLAAEHGMAERAERYFMMALEINPDYYGALMEEGLVRYRAKDYSGALEMFRRASKVGGDLPWPWYRIGICLAELGDKKGAIEAFRKSRERGGGETRFFHALGRALESDGNVVEAERQFAAAAYYHPEGPENWLVLLDFHVRYGNLDGVRDACARLASLRVDPLRIGERCRAFADDLP